MDCQMTNWTYAKNNVPNLKDFQDICEEDLLPLQQALLGIRLDDLIVQQNWQNIIQRNIKASHTKEQIKIHRFILFLNISFQ